MSDTTGTGAIRDPRAPVVAALIASGALTIFDVSKVGVALPSIAESLGGAPSSVQLMVVGYTLAYALFLLPAGRLGDMTSRRTIFLIGVAVFGAGSLVCSVAPDEFWFIAGRFLAGAGAGILMPQVIGLIQRLYVPAERARPLAALAVTTTITAAIGPMIAGAIIDLAGAEIGWRALFVVNVAFSAITFAICAKRLPEPVSERRRGYDLPGVLVLSAAILFVIVPLSGVEDLSEVGWIGVASIVAGILTLAGFLLLERRRAHRGAEPLFDPTLLRRPHFPLGVLLAGLFHASGTGSALIVTLFLQADSGLSPFLTAIAMVGSAISVSLASSFSARRTPRVSFGLIPVGAALSALSLGGMALAVALIPATQVVPVISVLLFTNGLGTGLVGAPNQARTLSRIPEYRASVAGSSIQLSQRSFSAIGMALVVSLYYGIQAHSASDALTPPGMVAALVFCSSVNALGFVVASLDAREPRSKGRFH